MKRKSAKPRPPRARRRAAEDATAAEELSVLPMEVQIGDRLTDEEGEWEVVTHPAALHGGKTLRASVQRPGQPATEREVTWPAHVRLDVRRRPGATPSA